MVKHLRNEMKDGIAFLFGMVTGFWKYWSDHSVILLSAKWAAVLEGAGTALLFGACGIIGKKLGEIIWLYFKKLIKPK